MNSYQSPDERDSNEKLEEKTIFMEKMVKRLNHLLLKYQKTSDDGDDQNVEGGNDLTVWYSDPTILHPILKEYDHQVEEAKSENQLLIDKSKKFQNQIKELTGENEYLYKELKQSISSQIDINKFEGNLSKQNLADHLKEAKSKITDLFHKSEIFRQKSNSCTEMTDDFLTNLKETVKRHKNDIDQKDYETQVKLMTRKVSKLNQRNEEMRLSHVKKVQNELKSSNNRTTENPKVEDFLKECEELSEENLSLVKDIEKSAVDLNIQTAAYNENISKMEKDVQILSDKHKEIMMIAKNLQSKNLQIDEELKKIVLLCSQLLSANFETGNFQSSEHQILIENLQNQLKISNQEKEIALQLQNDVMKQIDSSRQNHLSEAALNRRKEAINDDIQSQNRTLEQLNANLHDNLKDLKQANQDLTYTVTDQFESLKNYKEEIENQQKIMKNVKRNEQNALEVAEQLKNRVLKLENERGEVENENQKNLQIIENLTNNLYEVESRLAAESKRSESLETEKQLLSNRICTIETSRAQVESKELDYLAQIREGAQLLDDSRLERDSAIAREKQLREELDATATAMERLVEEVATRIQSEVDKCRCQANEKSNRLLCEIETMAIEAADLKSEVERSQRAKRSAENAMNSMQRQLRELRENSQNVELQRLLMTSERNREDLEDHLQALEAKLKERRLEYENSVCSEVERNRKLEEKVEKLKREVEDLLNNNARLVEELDGYKSDAKKFENEARFSSLEASRKLASDRVVFSRANKNLQNKLKLIDQQKMETTKHLQKMVTEQQRITVRWKEEACNIAEKYEERIKDYEEQLIEHRRRFNDLDDKLKENIQLNSENENRIRSLERSNRNLREKLFNTNSTKIEKLQTSNNDSLYLCDYKY